MHHYLLWQHLGIFQYSLTLVCLQIRCSYTFTSWFHAHVTWFPNSIFALMQINNGSKTWLMIFLILCIFVAIFRELPRLYPSGISIESIFILSWFSIYKSSNKMCVPCWFYIPLLWLESKNQQQSNINQNWWQLRLFE